MKKITLLLIVTLLAIKSCCQLTRNFDKYENKITISYYNPSISFYKYINVKPKEGYLDTFYTASFHIYDTYLTFSANGAILLFSDGTKLEYNDDVDVDYAGKGFYEYTFYAYGQELYEKLASTSLIGFKLHIFQKDLPKTQSVQIMNVAKKMLSAK